jgi:hypothetical protein
MTLQTIVRSSLLVAGFLSTAAVAAARQPPALLNAQQESEQALCEGARPVSGPGYRDAALRFGSDGSPTARTATVQAAGYRDVHARIAPSATNLAACTQRGGSVKLAASR